MMTAPSRTLTPGEEELLALFASLGKGDQQLLIRIARAFSQIDPRETTPSVHDTRDGWG